MLILVDTNLEHCMQSYKTAASCFSPLKQDLVAFLHVKWQIHQIQLFLQGTDLCFIIRSEIGYVAGMFLSQVLSQPSKIRPTKELVWHIRWWIQQIALDRFNEALKR